MDPLKIAALLGGGFLLAFGLLTYRYFYAILGLSAGVALAVAVRGPLLSVGGLSERPGVAGVLIYLLCVLLGIFLATRFKKVLAFVGGIGTGVILSRAVSVFMGDGAAPSGLFDPSSFAAMDALAGLVTGLLFVLFESVFALMLTSAMGAALCSWALGGRWTFPVFLIIGLVAQPLITARAGRGGGNGNDSGTTRITAAVLLLLLIPGLAAGSAVARINAGSGRAVLDMGWRNGVAPGEVYAVLAPDGGMVASVTVDEVFSDTCYSKPLPRQQLLKLKPGMDVIPLEEYEYRLAMREGGGSRLQEFLTRYPNSSRRSEVQKALDRSRYRSASLDNSIRAYREFRRRYPGNSYADEAYQQEQSLALEEAMEAGTEEAFRSFLRQYPDTSLVTGLSEIKAYLRAVRREKVYAFREFREGYPDGPLAASLAPPIREFEKWADELEFGQDPVSALRYFGRVGDETAVPLLVGKLMVPELRQEARKAILAIGGPALVTLLEVLGTPLQSNDLKDRVAGIVAELGEISAIPALRTYVESENTPAGRQALKTLAGAAAR